MPQSASGSLPSLGGTDHDNRPADHGGVPAGADERAAERAGGGVGGAGGHETGEIQGMSVHIGPPDMSMFFHINVFAGISMPL